MKIINTDNINFIEVWVDSRWENFWLIIDLWESTLNIRPDEYDKLSFIGWKAKDFKDLLNIELPKKKPKNI